jgi:hypothetical protein
MGVLDDAIREHLDLKRRHGASEEELRRQAVEALGPARRDVATAESEGEAQGQAVAEEGPETVAEPAAEAAGDHEQTEGVAEPDLDAASQPAPDVAADQEPDADVVGEPLVDEPDEVPSSEWLETGGAAEREAVDPEPKEGEPEETLESEEAAEPGSGEGRAEAAGEADGGEGVLEDTPDFLRETPEHDRLWSEQKPPRDFDFD